MVLQREGSRRHLATPAIVHLSRWGVSQPTIERRTHPPTVVWLRRPVLDRHAVGGGHADSRASHP